MFWLIAPRCSKAPRSIYLVSMSTCYGLKAENIEDDLSRHVDMGTSRWTCYPLVICWNMSHNFQAPTSQTKLSLPAISINFIRTTDPGGRHRISTHLPRMPKSVTCPVGCDHSNPQISAVSWPCAASLSTDSRLILPYLHIPLSEVVRL